MDDQGDREYARTPQIQDLIALCKSLNEQEVRYLVIGGFAVILQGYLRGTKDIDLLVEPSAENVRRIKKALSFLPDNAAAELGEDEIEKYEVVRVADEIVVDLMAKACGIGYAEAKASIEYRNIEGVKIPVAKKELLIRLKQSVRPSDQSDVEFLRYRLEEERKKQSR